MKIASLTSQAVGVRTARPNQAEAARLAPPGSRPPVAGRIHRARVLGPHDPDQNRVGRLSGMLPHSLRRLRDLPPLLLGPALGDHVEATGSLQHLPTHRGHVHAADHRAPKPLRRHDPPVRRLGRRDHRHPPQPLLAHRTALAQHPRVRRPRLVAVWYLPQLWAGGGPAIVWLIVAGGVLYTLGAVVYGAKKPDPSPTWFGFHEIFHAFTVAAWACHCIAVYLAVLGS